MQNINGENRDVLQSEFSNVLMKNILKNSEINMQESKSLAIPKRPMWKEGISAKEFERMEREAFLNWRRLLAEEEEKNLELAITPFEKNIEIWRQLWLVAEKSQVLIQIVDGRNPLFFRSPDLESYIKDLDTEKEILLLVNKADLLTPEIRRHWADYFIEKGIKYIFFSALVEAEKLDKAEEAERIRLESLIIKEDQNDKTIDENGNINFESDDESDYDENEYDRLKNQFMKLKVDKDEENIEESAQKESNQHKKETEIQEEKIEKTVVRANENGKEKEEIQTEKVKEETKNNVDEVKIIDNSEEDKKTLLTMSVEELEALHKKNLEIKILDRNELIYFMKELTKNKNKNNNTDHFFIGFIGYPNVGKSSVINVLMMKKRVRKSFF